MADETLPATRDPQAVRRAPTGMHAAEVVPEIAPSADPYAGIGTLVLSAEQRARLGKDIDPALVDVLPSGETYLPQTHYRHILNEVFGPGAWGLAPLGEYVRQGNVLCREWALYVQGRCVSAAIGAQEYVPSNARMTWADAAEAAKSNAVMRLCKDLGIAWQLWDKRWRETFRAAHCVRVWVKKEPDNPACKAEAMWRRTDALPFMRGGRVIECGVVAGPKSVPITRPRATGSEEPDPPLPDIEIEGCRPEQSGQGAFFDDPAGEMRAQEEKGAQRPEPKKQRSEPKAPAPGCIDAKQIGALMVALRETGKTEEELHVFLRNQFAIESRRDIPTVLFDAVLGWCATPKPAAPAGGGRRSHARIVCRTRGRR